MASADRSPITSSEIDANSRSGLSSELEFVILNVYVTSSPIFDSSSPVFSIITDGWNRFTVHESLPLSTFGNPIGLQEYEAVLTNGSGSPACTV